FPPDAWHSRRSSVPLVGTAVRRRHTLARGPTDVCNGEPWQLGFTARLHPCRRRERGGAGEHLGFSDAGGPWRRGGLRGALPWMRVPDLLSDHGCGDGTGAGLPAGPDRRLPGDPAGEPMVPGRWARGHGGGW